MIKYLFLFLCAQAAIAQSVSTFVSDSTVIISDAMAFDTAGNLYGSDFNGDTVYKITSQGVATPFITGLQNPNGLALDENDNLYVAEYSASRINKYDIDGNLLETFPTGGLTSGLIKDVNGPGFIYTNVSDDSINSLGLDGTITPLFQGAPLVDPVGLAFDDAGVLFAGNFTGRKIHKISAGTATFVATIPDGNALGFITYAQGYLYGTNFGGHKIYRINPNGVDDLELYAGGVQGEMDGGLADATFDTPNGIVYNALQNAFYVSEFNSNGNIRRIDDAILAVTAFEQLKIVVYPNPASERLVVESNTTHVQSIHVFDMQGKMVMNEKHTAGLQINLDITSLNSGLYLIQMETANGIQIRKFLKK